MKSASIIRLRLLLLWGTVWVFALSQTALAQTGKVNGTITSQLTSAPVPAASVTVKGTHVSTIANDAGKFSITAAIGDILQITSVGFVSREIKITSNEMKIELQEAESQLENVVVIGYGVQKKKLVTGANVQVKGADLEKQNTTTALQALQGQAPGVQITSYSGQPGAGMNVVIRGKGTVGNFSPLYIVDGVQTSDISYLNPADIASMDILKDAASAAIYGSQAANGVILVTTRTGKVNQKPQVTLDAYYGLQQVPRKTRLLNAKEYATIINEAAVNSGKAPYFSDDVVNNLPVNTNWLDQMFKSNVPTQNYVLGVQGGNAGSIYSLSLGYTSQGGIVGGSGISYFDRYTFRINSEHNLYQNIVKIGEHLTFNYQNNHGILVDGQYNNTLRSAFTVSPFLPMYDADGNYYPSDRKGWYPGKPDQSWNNGEANPYAVMDYTTRNRNSNQGLFGDVYLQVEPIKGLKFRSSLGLNYYANQSHGYTPVYHLSIYSFNDTAKVSQSMGSGRTIQFDNLLSYDFNVHTDHHFSAMVGSSSLKTQTVAMNGSNFDLRVADMRHAYLSVAQNVNRGAPYMSVGGGPTESALMSVFGRLQYDFREKYLLNLTFRADGSSRFAPGNRWGYFPSVSAGWVTTMEDFMQGVDWLNFLKIRGSWGQVGNQNVTAYQFLSPITFSNTYYIFGPVEGVNTQGAYPSRIANPNVKWETSEQTNIGFDATLFDRLNVTFDYYVKKTKDWLITVPILATAGADAPLINGGDVKNSGVELALNYSNSIGKDFSYSIGVNGAYNKNRIGNIPTNDHVLHGNTNVLYANAGEFYRAANGEPVGYFWGYKTAGIFQSTDEVLAYKGPDGKPIQPDAKPGDVRYVDLDGNGVIDANDKTKIGDPNPHFTYGFNITLGYKGFDFLVQASGVTGNQIIQSYRSPGGFGNYTAEILDRWHGPGTSNRIPRVTEDGVNWSQISDLYVYDGKYLRINNITLGYDFSRLAKKSYLGKVRVYASVQNAFIITKYKGMDPEVGYNEGFSSGVDLGYYPRPRTYMVGANIRF
ncbi:TonB-linked outer membrane protein, SusC/RagA family [Chitinophaga terrae (ex Kim and Jung 2007)]|uniref:TonB-linked outer membrane protein, SusC/RagA family n=1 Tax=Chitinophaga terrae (ex Kim and Jung 2007) TaxID=408074 RepID=A0A1H4GH92_9BACT|nr:TonB-dependent receptor [Chitinophaga terrae (ex Kim and Jung 2007)]GEP93404.1 SusC/RagA family TonB-linked outer membrane protein [Chitinophaga terrae (ex Kim and Jung 2007)]SEB08370.1 TonB-linked outer membrane protein, SusC/RagA family [Chitinophaga terrae (ex Kim and Jung 2007)]